MQNGKKNQPNKQKQNKMTPKFDSHFDIRKYFDNLILYDKEGK